jgi:hypothetical protein
MEEVLQQLENLEKAKRAGVPANGSGGLVIADLLPSGSAHSGEVEAHFPAPRDDAAGSSLPLSVLPPPSFAFALHSFTPHPRPSP